MFDCHIVPAAKWSNGSDGSTTVGKVFGNTYVFVKTNGNIRTNYWMDPQNGLTDFFEILNFLEICLILLIPTIY